MKILAIDLGKFKSVACDFDSTTTEHEFTTLPTRPAAMHDLLVEREPDRVVIEIGSPPESWRGGSRTCASCWRSPSRWPTPTTRHS